MKFLKLKVNELINFLSNMANFDPSNKNASKESSNLSYLNF